ncbi:methylated-DNA-[protein]-cysteine S-methyltransferase [Arthrobacter sp. PL16]|uniref:methylated-DNA--[protein]-cysteine S-methyltransferase n=1 Tax=Arthrobacter sp. PL16 TaxID=3071720 RepID=UPI002DFE6F45|nr:methylated-DNA-[protein]-cysteine S-methyltransferase [Arthrobacter sp. PL16]
MTSIESSSAEEGPNAPGAERRYLDIDSPVGVLRIVANGEAIVGLYHEDHSPVPARSLLGRPLEPSVVVPADGNQAEAGPDVSPSATEVLLWRAASEIGQYFAGSRRHFDVPVDLRGTEFQRMVWTALSGIPYGQRRSYRDIAANLGNAGMGRAVGAAIRANPVSIIVPGHRVVSSTGAVVGYAAGNATKTELLERESDGVPDADPVASGSKESVVDAPGSPGVR